MSTVEEIELAIEALPPEKAAEVFAWLQARRERGLPSSGGFPLFGLLEGKITYHQGWDEPLEDFESYAK